MEQEKQNDRRDSWNGFRYAPPRFPNRARFRCLAGSHQRRQIPLRHADGKMVRVEIDARVGGAFNFTDRRDGDDVEHVGFYLEIDRPRRLAFTFAVPKYSKQFTRVSIDSQAAPHRVRITLSQEGTLPEWVDRTREGWGKIVDNLAANFRCRSCVTANPEAR